MGDHDRKNPFREKGRVDVDWPARIRLADGSGAPVVAKITDLGMGGASLAGSAVFPSGTELRVEIAPPGEGRTALVLPAVVRWTGALNEGEQTVQLGVAFEGLSPEETAALAELLSYVPAVRDLAE